MANKKETLEKLIPGLAKFLAEGTDAGQLVLMLQNAGFDVTFETYVNSHRSKNDFIHEIFVSHKRTNNYAPFNKIADLLLVEEYFRPDEYQYKYDKNMARSLSDRLKACLKDREPLTEKELNRILLKALNIHKGLEAVARDFFIEGHWEQAANEACKFLENYIQSKIGEKSKIGVELMATAFNPQNPKLSLYKLPMDKEQRNEQEGFHLLNRGEVQFLKNRLSHKEKGTVITTRSAAMKVLGLVSLLLEHIDSMYVVGGTGNAPREEIPF